MDNVLINLLLFKMADGRHLKNGKIGGHISGTVTVGLQDFF